MRSFFFMFSWHFAEVVVYMLQSTEYKVPAYLSWLHRTKDFRKVMYRRKLDRTKSARLLVAALRLGMYGQLLLGLGFAIAGYQTGNLILSGISLFLVLSFPTVWAYLVTVPLQLGRWLIMNPRYRRQVKVSEKIFADHPGLKIAVAGSYGKTSMKELLNTVLSEGLKVAATPANKNVAISHARFAEKLKGDEEVLIIEYGEGGPGDVTRFAKITHPDLGVITGLAPAHLDNYPSLQAAGEDIFSLANFVETNKLFVNGESEAAQKFITKDMQTYTREQALGWKISDIKVDFSGVKFVMKRDKVVLHLHSGLLGRHQVGPLAFVAGAAHELGLTKKQIEEGIGKTKAFEQRMEPLSIKGAWILNDGYNGNIDGMKAGLKLLEELPGKRKIYVTPGLVDQGDETQTVHQELGRAIAAAKPDQVVLMHNSATKDIQLGLEELEFNGDLRVEHHPLDYYLNLEHFVAAGDVVMLQNDWTDNYN